MHPDSPAHPQQMPQPPSWNILGFERRRRRRKSAFLLANLQEGWRQNNKPTGRCKHPARIPPSEWCSSGRDEEAFLIEGKKKKKRISPFQGDILSKISKTKLPPKQGSLFSLFLFSFSHLLLCKGGKHLLLATALQSGSQGGFQTSPAKVLNASVHWRLAVWQTFCLFSCKL